MSKAYDLRLEAISIHTLIRGWNIKFDRKSCKFINFNPHPHKRVKPDTPQSQINANLISIHTLIRGWNLLLIMILLQLLRISIHTLIRGWNSTNSIRWLYTTISIHTLIRGWNDLSTIFNSETLTISIHTLIRGWNVDKVFFNGI